MMIMTTVLAICVHIDTPDKMVYSLLMQRYIKRVTLTANGKMQFKVKAGQASPDNFCSTNV